MRTNDLTQHADDVYEAIRAMNHATIAAGPGHSLPAPVVYQLLGNLNNAGYGLAQLLHQLEAALAASLTDYHVYDRNRDPSESLAIVGQALRAAAHHAHELGDLLAAAQTAINLQGHDGHKTTPSSHTTTPGTENSEC